MSIGSLGTIWAELGVNTKKFDEGIMAAQLKIAKADGSITSFGQKWTNQSTHMLTAGGLMVGAVGAIGVATVKMAADFEKSMRNVNSISKLSESQFASMSKEVLQLSTKMPQSAKTLADGLYDISSSGFQGAEGMKVLEASAKAASAGMTTTAVSAKGVTAVLNAYGLEADKASEVSDTMFRTVDKGVITFEELSSTVGDWVGMAKAANLSFNEASGAIAYMTTKGISASEAGVSLSRMLTGIIKPTDQMAAVIKNAGFESGEMMLKTLGLTGSMDVLNKATGGSITKLIELIPEIRGVRGANALLGAGYEELTDYMQGFVDTTGSADIALKEQSKSLDYQLQLLKNNVSAIGITLGNKYIPAITNTTTALSKYISTNNEAISSTVDFGLKSIASIGGILLLTGAVGKLRGILTTPIGKAGGIAAALVAVGIGIDELAKKLDSIDTKWGEFGEASVSALKPLQATYNGIKNNIIIAQALADGLIELDDVKNLNVFTMDKEIEKIKELRAAQEGNTTATDKYLEGMTALKVAQHQGRDITIEQTLAYQDNETVIQSLIDKTGKTRQECIEYAEAQGLLKTATDETITSTDEQTKALEKQKEIRKQLYEAIQTMYSALFDEYLLNADISEGLKAANNAYSEYTKVVEAHGIKSDEAREKEEEWVRIIDGLTSNQIPELINKTGILTEEEIKHLKGMQDQIDKAKELGIISPQEWEKISKSINDKIEGSILPGFLMMKNRAEELGHLSVYPKIGLDTTEFDASARRIADMLNTLGSYRGMKAMGGIVGYADGGIIGGNGFNMPMLTAATGLVTPQTGHKIPVMAEEGELILNSSQQNNVAQAIFGVANGQKAGGGVNIENFNVITPTGSPAEIARESRLQLRLMGMEASLS